MMKNNYIITFMFIITGLILASGYVIAVPMLLSMASTFAVMLGITLLIVLMLLTFYYGTLVSKFIFGVK